MPFGLERVSVTAQVEALMPSQPSLELIALLAALVGDALVLLFVDDPWTRLLLGLLLLSSLFTSGVSYACAVKCSSCSMRFDV